METNTNITVENKKTDNKLFVYKNANDWINDAKNKQIPKMIFSEFWFENELCIMFSDTNVGKSILAVQIANIISKGLNSKGFKYESKPQKVLYFDFELSDKQFENRYSENYEEHYSFDNNFIRVEMNPDAVVTNIKNYEDYLADAFEKVIISTGSKVVIVDNITFLRAETENAKNALPLMKLLKNLKSKHNLSLLILAHTPKRDLTKPITKNDLAGSKMLINFCDSSFTIGSSAIDSNMRYLKQIKQRNCEEVYGADNVMVCQIIKEKSFLNFEFIENTEEYIHLSESNSKNDKANKEETISKVKELNKEGYTQREISEILGIALGTVNKYLKT
jgi:RecA-family ATPase